MSEKHRGYLVVHYGLQSLSESTYTAALQLIALSSRTGYRAKVNTRLAAPLASYGANGGPTLPAARSLIYLVPLGSRPSSSLK